MNATTNEELSKAVAVLPIAAELVKSQLDSIARAVPEEFLRQRVSISTKGAWWDLIPCIYRGLRAYWRLFMLRLSLCIHSKAGIVRHLEALRLYLAIPK